MDYVYCWHGLPAYWSGVMPGAPEMEQYHPTLMYGDATPGVLEVEPSMAWNPAALAGGFEQLIQIRTAVCSGACSAPCKLVSVLLFC